MPPLMFVTIGTIILALSLLSRLRRFRTRSVQQFAMSIDLPMTDEIADAIDRRLMRRTTITVIAGAIALAVIAIVGVADPTTFDPAWATHSYASLFIAAIALGVAVAALAQFSSAAPGAPRVARASTPTLTDYVLPVRIALGVAAPILGVVATAIALSASPAFADSRRTTIVAVAFAVASALILAAVILLGRKVLNTPQPASTSTELAWDDALRALALRDLWTAPVAVGLAALTVALGAMFPDWDGLVLVGAWLVSWFPIVLLAGGPGTRFQKRLWPETVPHYGSPETEVPAGTAP